MILTKKSERIPISSKPPTAERSSPLVPELSINLPVMELAMSFIITRMEAKSSMRIEKLKCMPAMNIMRKKAGFSALENVL